MKVLHIIFANPAAYPPVAHSAKICAENDWEVVVLGVTTSSTDVMQFPKHPNIRLKRIRADGTGIRNKLSYLRFCITAAWLLIRWRPDWAYFSDMLTTPLGWLVARLRFARSVYHEHDTPYEAGPGFSAASRFIRLILRCRRQFVRCATFCMLPNEKRLADLRATSGSSRPFLCVWNCPLLEEATIPRQRIQPNELVLFYHGSLVPDRLPLTLLDALKECDGDVCLKFVGYETAGHVGYGNEFLQYADNLGIGARVTYLGTLPTRHMVLAECAKAHIGVSLMPMDSFDPNMRSMVGASNKPFDYLLAGLALIVSKLPDWETAFVETGYGIACDPRNSQSLAAAIQWYGSNREECEKIGQRGRAKIQSEWNYERQFQTALTLMQTAGD